MKISNNLGEFQKFIDSDNKKGECLEDTLKFFNIQRIFGQFELIKQNGTVRGLFRDNQRTEEIMRMFSPVFEKKSTA